MFDKVLIANRGAIACRIIRTLRSMGIEPVAVFSDADRNSPHVRLADHSVHIGPAAARQSYLNAEAVIEAHRQGIMITGFDATDVGLAAIDAGQVAATIDQAPGKQARLAIQLLLRHLEKGETFPSIIFMPEIPLVTQENVGDYLSEK